MLETLLSDEEFRSIPGSISQKLDSLIVGYIESYKQSQAEEYDKLNGKIAEEAERNERINIAVEQKYKELENVEKKLEARDRENLQLKADIIRHRDEAQTFRLQRDEVMDQQSILEGMLDRRSKELENLKIDRDSLLEKLKAAVEAKIQALSLLDEIQSKTIELDFKDKRLDKEKELLNEQIILLTNDVAKYSKDIVNMRRENNSQIIALQTQLQQKDEEISVLLENEEKFKKNIQSLNAKLEDLNSRLTGQSEIENQLQQKYIQEIESRCKLADVYKEMSEESNKKAEKLSETTKELQKLLSDASEQYKELEHRFTVNETTYQEHLSKKNETIAALKKELVDANNLIDVLKNGNLNETIESLSPHAAAAYNMMQRGLTLTQIYTEYATVSEQLLIKTHDNDQLQSTFKSFLEELEGKAAILKKRNEDYAEAMATVEKISYNYDQLEMDYNVLKDKCAEADRNVAHLTRDREKLQKTIADLGRQVCFLLKEVEECRGGEIVMKHIQNDTSMDTSDCSNSSDIINRKLVTFHDIQDLQQNNEKLLGVIRDLSEEFEKAEAKLKNYNKEETEEKVKTLKNTLNEKTEAAARQEKIIQMLKSQIKMMQIVSNDTSPVGRRKVISDDLLEVKEMVDVSVQTNSAEVESMFVANIQKELNQTKKSLSNLKAEFETAEKEHAANEKSLLESIEKSDRSYQKVLQDSRKTLAQVEISQQRCKTLESHIESLKTEISALENRCKMYSKTIGNQEQTINSFREDAMNSMTALSKSEVLLENSKRECALLRETEIRLRTERDILKQDKQGHAYLLSNLESIKASIDRSESEWKCKMEEKLDSATKECSALRRRLQDEQDRYAEKVALLEQNVETARSRLEEEKNSSSELMNITNSLRLDLAEKNKNIEELNEKLRMASSKSIDELEIQTRSLQNKYQAALKDIEHQKELLNTAKKDTEEISRLSENFEKQFVSEREAHLKYKREMEAKISSLESEMSTLQKLNDVLQKRVNELSNVNQSSMIDLNKELMQEKRKLATALDELGNLKLQLSAAQKELGAAVEAKLLAEKKYADEMLQHTNDIKELQKQVEDILKLKNQVASLTNERDTAVMQAEIVNSNWREEEARLKQEMITQNEKLKEFMQQNEVLLNKIQELSLNMAVSHSQESQKGLQEDSLLSMAENPNEQTTDNWLQVIRFLRREKNLAVSNMNALSAENLRLKSELELVKRQLNETVVQLKAEQDKTDISNTTFAKHSELLKKVQTFSAVIDSNRVLRDDRDKFLAELNELKTKLDHVESQTVVPLRNEIRRLQSQIETSQIENAGLQNRVAFLTKEMNKTNPEDVKDLKKSLNIEREAYNKTLDELRSVKQEKSKLEEQIKKSNNRLSSLEKERNELQKENVENKNKMEKINRDFAELQKNFVEQEEMIGKVKSSNVALKAIARKYKSQFLEQSEQIKKLEEKAPETPAAPIDAVPPQVSEIPVAEQNRLRQEGRQLMENEMNERVRQLNEQLTTNQGQIDKLITENDNLQQAVKEKEVRAADILQQAKQKILGLVKAVKKHQSEAKSYKERLTSLEASKEEAAARENVLKSAYENRISRLEKEKTEMQAERDRSLREVEVSAQRINTLQRQLHSQPGVKSNTNSSQEKSNVEPPTANIKPMAGPSSSKSQQNQQSVAVTPWRSVSETPLASIRPMSLQTRTAAVLPTSQTSCSASQSTVMVPPQQQLVDTSSNAPSIVEAFSSSPSSSSHSDYNLPSTSSSVSHPSVRQVVVTPTQQASHSAESTQDMEAECGNQELTSQTSHSSQQPSTQTSQNATTGLSALSQIMAAPTVSQSQTPTVALVLPRIDLQNVSAPGSSHQSNAPEQSVVASSQSTVAGPHVSASNQSDQKRSETYYQQDTEDSNLGQVSASNQHSQQPIVASSIETAPEQSIIIASSQQLYEPSVASSNANSSNTVTTTQAGLKRTREPEGESSKSSSSSNTETSSAQPQVKRTRRIELMHEDLFRNEIDESGNADMLLRYGALDVEYQVPTSSQRDQEFDNLVIDSDGEDELEEDEQAMPDDGIIDETDDVQEYVEDEDVEENEEVYEMEEGYEREEQDTTMTSYNVIEGPDIDEESVQGQDQDNEVEIMDEESNEVPNQSGRSDSSGGPAANRRSCEQQSSEASSSGNNLRAQSTSITSNQSSVPLQFNRRPSTISPLNRQQNQQLLLSQGFEDNIGDDGIVPSTPTLCVPRRTDGFGEAVSSPHVPSGGRFTFNESNPPPSRAAVIQMVSEGIDDTRMDLSQLDENSGTGRSVPSTPLQSSPQDIERIEIGQSVDDSQPLNEELTSNSNQVQPQPPENILNDNENFCGEPADHEVEVTNENENLIDEPGDRSREESADGVTSEGQSDPSVAGSSQASSHEEEGREAEAAATKGNDSKTTLPSPTMINTARRSATGRIGRARGTRANVGWPNSPRGGIRPSIIDPTQEGIRGRGTFRDRSRKPKQWYTFPKRYPQ